MATLDDSPSLYLGQQWTHWAEKVEEKSKNDRPAAKDERCNSDDGDTIKLRHQDMPLYGLCPARDEFYLVVCECCEQVIKPQALKRHIEQRHGVASPRASGTRKSKGSPGRHSGSPARHTGSPGRHVSPKRDSHGKTLTPSPVKTSSKSSGSSSHRSSASNAKSKKSNHSMPVVKVERMLPSAISSKSNSSPSTKVSSTRHEHNDHKEHKHEKDHRDHSKESHREHKHEKEHKESHREKDYQEHHKDHREHSRDHKDKDHKHDKEHKEKEHPKEKEHIKEKEHTKEKERREHTKDRDHRERERERDRKDRDRDRDRNSSKEKDYRAKDHERQEKEKREKDKSDSDHKEKSEKAEHKEKELKEKEQKEKERKEKEQKEKERKEKEQKENERKEKEQKEKERKEKEQKEKERKEKELKEKERKEKELKEKERKEKEKEIKENERKEKELKEKERKEKEQKEKERKEKERKEKERKEKERKEKDRKEKERKEKEQHKEHRDHKDHREKKAASNTNSSSLTSTSQTTSSVTPPRPSSSHKMSVSTPSPSTVSSSSMASPCERSGKQKFVKEKMLPCKDREFDANKHCGVWIPEIARQCTRSLTCKTHALSLRRGVQGRRKPFDELLKEHRAAKEAFLKAKAEEKEAAAIIKAGGIPPIPITSASTKNSVTATGLGSQSRENAKTDPGTVAPSSTKTAVCTATPVAKSSKLPKVASPSPSRPAPTSAPPQKEEVGADSSSRLSSDDDDDNDERDRLGFPMLSHQPRPAVVNSFGARRYSGSSCIVFNRKSDFLRAAFHACVERHLHPPPYKKLCVESKLPQGSHMATNAHDPYDFPTMDLGALATNGLGSPPDPFSPSSSHNSSLKPSWNSNKLSPKVKPKSAVAVTLSSPTSSTSRNIRPKDPVTNVTASGLTSPMAMVIGGTMTSPITPITPITPTLTPVTPITPISRTGSLSANSVSLANSSAVGVKRKRSGSGTPVGGMTMHPLQPGLTMNNGTQGGNPISISIPSGGLNSLNLTQAQINSLNETILKVSGGSQVGGSQPQGNKNHLNLKDVNIVMTSHGDPGSVMNGQFVTTTAMPTSTIADIASLQLNSLSGEPTLNALHTQTHSHKKRLKLSQGVGGTNSGSHGLDGVGATVSTLTSLPGGMMVMPDLTGQQTTFTHSFGSTGLLTTNADFSASKLSPSTTSPLFASGSASPQAPGSSLMANGMFGHGLELKVNHGLPVNHVAGAMMVSPGSASSTPSPQITDTTHHRSSTKAMRLSSMSRKSSGSRSKSHSRTQQLAPQVAASQQLTAAAITLTTPGNRLLSTTLPTMYTMDTSSGKFQHIQIQPKASSKQQTLATGKLSMQPMLTIPMATVTSPQQQAHATLLLQSDDHQLSGAHHAAAAQLQNSPSNVLS